VTFLYIYIVLWLGSSPPFYSEGLLEGTRVEGVEVLSLTRDCPSGAHLSSPPPISGINLQK
jgi:hypothetical protein